jgi:hypothetical protein
MKPKTICKIQAAEPAAALRVLPEVLSEDYVLQPYDILSGRGRATFNSIGNRHFRVVLSLIFKRYKAAKRRKEKSILINSVVENIRSNGGRFLHQKHGRWEEIGDQAAREKVAHALRDMSSGSRERTKKQRKRDDGRQSSPLSSLEQSECGSVMTALLPQHPDSMSEGSESIVGTNDSTHEAKESGEHVDEFDHLIAALAFSEFESGDESSMSFQSERYYSDELNLIACWETMI